VLTLQVNVNGVYFLTVNFVPLLRKSADPNVCVIASLAALANIRSMGSITYGVSKAAGTHMNHPQPPKFTVQYY
jgi:NAD(P)-dependent dehydrogenase (short-subunit alcohol dehydrogenase family)